MYNHFSKRLPDNPHTQLLMERIERAAEQYLELPIQVLPYSKYKIYYEQGTRLPYENVYIERRRHLDALAAMALYDSDKKWIAALEDIIWAICDEYTWAFPTHIPQDTPIEKVVTWIDLFAAETGQALSEIYYLLQDRLAPRVVERMTFEINRRIIHSYLSERQQFPENNWSAVCAGCVGCAFIYLGKDKEFALVKEDLLASMQRFLDSYQEDGCCLEGVLYWAYGFGYFCTFAQLLKEYTKGEIDLFQQEKVHAIARFRQAAYLDKNIIVPFADAPHNNNFNIGLAHFLAHQYDDVTYPDETYENLFDDDIRYRFADFIRNFFWYDPLLQRKEEENKCTIFEKSQWYIDKRYPFAFAAKGGYNGEPHNHNDLGGFVVLKDGAFLIDDLGWPEYNLDYGKNHHTHLCSSSRGHSVPIVDGEHQKSGSAYFSKLLEAKEGKISLDLTNAYDIPTLKSFIRKFAVGAKEIVLSDHFEGTYQSITERFITRVEPFIEADGIRIGPLRIQANLPCVIGVHTETFKPRRNICKMDMKEIETAFLVDFQILNPQPVQDVVLTFCFEE